MSSPLVGEIAIFGFNFAPQGWAFCQGQLQAIEQNVPLFQVLGNAYGGNGETDFALPLLDCVPVGAGEGPGRSAYDLGETGGEVAVTLTPQQLPQHSHAFNAVTDQATSVSPEGNQLARAWQAQAHTDNVGNFYSADAGNAQTALSPNAIAANGSGAPHNNMQPYLALNFCIATQGIVPPRDGPPADPRVPFMGEISICAFGAAPANWALCEGQLLQIPLNQALFSLLGISFGGDGMRTFALPDLRGRVPLGFSENYSLGQIGGEEFHLLSTTEMPSHGHALMADATSTDGIGNTPSPAAVLGRSSGEVVPGNTPFTANLYDTAAPNTNLAGPSLGNTGGGQAHMNMMPSLALSFCINIDPHGVYPSRD